MAVTFDRELLSGHPIARTTSVDEALDAATRVYLPHRLELVERTSRLDMRLNAVRLNAVTAGYLWYGSDVRMVTTEATHYHVNIPLTGGTESRCGKKEPVLATPQKAAVFMPGLPADIRWRARCAQFCLMIARRDLGLALERLLGRPLTRPLEFETGMDLTTPSARTWLSSLDLLEREAGRPDGLLAHPIAAGHLESLVLDGLLLGQPHNYTGLLHAPHSPATPRAVRQAMELMDSQPERPWSSAGLAREVAVSVRSLQEGFQRSLETPPMVYLREVRLARIHAELVAAAPGTLTVSAVAGRWGFLHAGRFADAYKRKFGCCPSETLRR